MDRASSTKSARGGVKSTRGKGQANRKNGGTRNRVLKVALSEFAAKGLSGARVDRIASRAKTSKHMIYYHFGSKAGLYSAVLEEAYDGIRSVEADIDVDGMDPVDALRSIVRLSFDYHCDNEMFVRLVMNENIHQARHVTRQQVQGNRRIIDILTRILERGRESGRLRDDIDPRQLHLTISGLGFHFVSNKYTFSKIFEIDMDSPTVRSRRREIAVDIIVRWCTP